MNEKQDFLKNLIDKLPNTYESGQLVPMVLNLVMGDMIFEEYSYEEEDYISNLENPCIYDNIIMPRIILRRRHDGIIEVD